MRGVAKYCVHFSVYQRDTSHDFSLGGNSFRILSVQKNLKAFENCENI